MFHFFKAFSISCLVLGDDMTGLLDFHLVLSPVYRGYFVISFCSRISRIFDFFFLSSSVYLRHLIFSFCSPAYCEYFMDFLLLIPRILRLFDVFQTDTCRLLMIVPEFRCNLLSNIQILRRVQI